MPNGFHHHGSGGRRRSYYSSSFQFPAYAIVPETASECSCAGKAGAVSALEKWAKDNPLLAFAGVFALGYLLRGKK